MAQGPLRKSALLAATLALGACASNPPAPVEDRSSGDSRPVEAGAAAAAPAAARSDERHVVERGDTLYAIAFRRGVDFRDLAAWNGIAPPYRIFVGQPLRLSAPPGVPQQAPASAANGNANAVAAPERVATVSAPAQTMPQNPPVEKSTKPQPSMFEDVAAAPAPEPAATPESAPPAPKPPAPPPAAAPVAPVATPKPAPKPLEAPPPEMPADKPPERVAELNAGGVNWRWPGDGRVVGTFVAGDQIRQGIDIAGKAGDAVRAAAAGEVVYSGNGLLGYGELIIIKHNASFLSAYGYNRQRLVKEGDRVKAGQQIAELGSSASAREELHFEIRKNGKPVNPLDYLPVR